MVTSILALKPALLELLHRICERHEGYTGFSIGPEDVLVKDIYQITWSALEDFCAFLKVFKDATELMSGSKYPTLGLVVPVYFLLEQHVQKATDASNGFCLTHTMRFANAVKQKLLEYKEVVNQKRVVLASSLDPRVKSLLDQVGLSVDQIQTHLVEEWKLNYENSYAADAASSVASSSFPGPFSETSFLSLLHPATNSETIQELFSNEVRRWISHAPMSIKQSS
jgi:hypothetical protein